MISQLIKKRNNNYIKHVTSNNQSEELGDGASELQAVLDSDLNANIENCITQLNADIKNLQDLVEDYINNLKFVNIDFNGINQLLKIYGSQTQIDPQTPNKPLIKAVLQRHVLTKILKFADSYFKIDFNQVDENLSYFLESNIAYKTNDLIKSIERLSYERVGSDLVTQAAPIKLRQQIFAVLGYRGFSDTFENGLHPYISEWREQLNQSINRYRLYKDSKKNASLNEKAIGLIKIYDIEEAFVDISSFPMIGRDFNDSKRKIFTLAKVFSRIKPKKRSNNATDSKMNVDSSNTEINKGSSKTEDIETESFKVEASTPKPDSSKTDLSKTVDSSKTYSSRIDDSSKTVDFSKTYSLNKILEGITPYK
ncbi:22432_t:CDS:2, partial [Dentiscutata erythropus]